MLMCRTPSFGSLSGNPLPMNWCSETSPCGHFSKAVSYNIAVSRDDPKIFANTLLFILAPAELSLVNTDNSHYYAGHTASEHNKCNLLITVSTKCGLYSVEFLLAQNFHSKANPAIDAAAS